MVEHHSPMFLPSIYLTSLHEAFLFLLYLHTGTRDGCSLVTWLEECLKWQMVTYLCAGNLGNSR